MKYDSTDWQFKNWLRIDERTLYHGTIIDNEDSIKRYGLQGGWHGPVGNFVSNFYDDNEYGEPTEEDEIVFASDKSSLGKSLTAMVFHISKKLNKDFQDVNDNDIRNHGLLVIIKNSDLSPYSSQNPKWAYERLPRGVEEGDYFDSSMGGDIYLRGSALLRYLNRNGVWPRDWGKSSNYDKYYRGRLGAMAISKGNEKNAALKKIQNASLDDVKKQLGYWENVNVIENVFKIPLSNIWIIHQSCNPLKNLNWIRSNYDVAFSKNFPQAFIGEPTEERYNCYFRLANDEKYDPYEDRWIEVPNEKIKIDSNFPKIFLGDGNNRAVVAFERGEKYLTVRIENIDKYPEWAKILHANKSL